MPVQLICKVCSCQFSVIPSRSGTASYCSKSCHARGTIVKLPTVVFRKCDECRNEYVVKSPGSKKRSSCCSKKCLGRLQSRLRKGSFQLGESNPAWKDGIQTYRKHKNESCNRCGSVKDLLVHHKDENRHNNDLGNLETLCIRCHQIHHDCVKNLRPSELFIECLMCGTRVKASSFQQKYCSTSCGTKFRLISLGVFSCKGCGAKFKPTDHKQKHCSKSCSNRFRNKST